MLLILCVEKQGACSWFSRLHESDDGESQGAVVMESVENRRSDSHSAQHGMTTLLSVLRSRNLLTVDQCNTLMREGIPTVDQIVHEERLINEDELLDALSREFALDRIDVRSVDVDPKILSRFSPTALFQHNMLPIDMTGTWLRVATHDPTNLRGIRELSAVSGFLIKTVLAPKGQIVSRLKETLGLGGATVNDLVGQSEDSDSVEALLVDESIDNSSQVASVVKLVNELVLDAVRQHASDVHIEPTGDGIDIRFRVDGMLRPQPIPPGIHRFQMAITSRLKIMAKLNIAEKRLPQDGRITINVGNSEIDVRLSTIPMLHGEGIVLRLLDKSQRRFDLSVVELSPSLRKEWEALIHRPHGILLVTGPTGSGKTTTLYSSLAEIAGRDKKIITIEDPVEYQLKGVNQIHVQTKIGLTFSAGLRSILRHDPDVILIGEIRDQETAISAMQASLTGHLVLSTLHTNDAASAFTRLVDMGIEPYLVASTVEAVLAQRLVRRVCPRCAQTFVPTSKDVPSDFPRMHGRPLTLAVATGCNDCGQTGYAGRMPIFELLTADPGIRHLINETANSSVLRKYAVENGLVTLRQAGWQRVITRDTTLEEIIRVCASDLGHASPELPGPSGMSSDSTEGFVGVPDA